MKLIGLVPSLSTISFSILYDGAGDERLILIGVLIGLAVLTAIITVAVIIKRQQTDKALYDAGQAYRTLVEQSLQGIAVIKNGRLVFANPAITQITGYSYDELSTRSIDGLLKLIHPEDQEQISQLLVGYQAGKPIVSRVEYRVIHKNGDILWIVAEAKEVEYEGQRAIQFMILDITEQKKIAKALEESQSLLAQAEEIAKSGTFDWDLTTNTAIWSPGMHSLFEIPPDNFNGDPAMTMSVVHPDDIPILAKAMQEVIENKQLESHLEYRIVLPSGKMRHIWAQGMLVLDDEGNATRMIGVCHDITPRKLVEEALRESEERFRQLAENIDEIFWITTANKDEMLYVSPAYERVWGRTCASLYASPRDWMEVIHPEDRGCVEHEALTRQIEGIYHEEYRIIRPDGTIRWIRDRAFPIKNESGQVNHIVGIAQDITASKQAEMIQRNYVSFLETMKNIDHIILNAQDIQQMLNDVLEKMLEVLDCDRAWLFFPCDPQTMTWSIPTEKSNPAYSGAGDLDSALPMNEGVKTMMQDHLTTQGIVVYNLEALKKIFGDSTEERYQTQSQMSIALHPKIGQPWLLGLHQCAYDRQWTEQDKNLFREIGGRISDSLSSLLLLDNLTQSEARYRAIVEDQTELICRSTPDHIITFVNDAYCRFFGIPREQLLGQSFLPLVPPELHELMYQKRTSLTPERPVTNGEFLERNADGVDHWLYWTERGIFDAEGRLIEIQSVGRDVTQRKLAEDEIRKLNEELEKRVAERTVQLQTVNQELESFSYSVSHDLRAPIRAINGFASLVISQSQNLDKETRRYLDKILQAGTQMGHLIDDLLKYSRLGRVSLHRANLSLLDLFEDILFDMQNHLEEVQGTVQLGENLPSVKGDHTLLLQIFTNLIENALKYRKPGVPPRLEITCHTGRTYVTVKVSDNGIGIPMEYKDKIFEVFQRLHREDEYPGTGIGLATVKKAANLMGGDVWVESNIGEGSTFFVKLLKM